MTTRDKLVEVAGGFAIAFVALVVAIILFAVGITGPILGVIVGLIVMFSIVGLAVRAGRCTANAPTSATRPTPTLGRDAPILAAVVFAISLALLATGGGTVELIAAVLTGATLAVLLFARRRRPSAADRQGADRH
jgi:hypothetical protein